VGAVQFIPRVDIPAKMAINDAEWKGSVGVENELNLLYYVIIMDQ